MEMDKNNIYTKELQLVINYMIETLGSEFPTKQFTPEYLILSMLDNTKSHANLILDSCLLSANFVQLKGIYVTYLSENCLKEDIKNDIIFDESLEEILRNAEIEAELTLSSKVGTEHVLLAMLNQETSFSKIRDVFKTLGIDYTFITSRLIEMVDRKNRQTTQKRNTPQQQLIPIIKKSDVNTKASVTKEEYINNYTINLTTLAREGKLDKLIGRERELDLIIKTLARRKKNNVILVGNGGCGKTVIVHGLAQRIIENNVPSILEGKEILQLNVMALVSGTHFRGMMEERVNGLFSELKENRNCILFLDDMQQVLKTGTKEKDTDLSSMLSEVLSEGYVSIIGTINHKDYRNSIESNTSLSRKMQKIVIEPNTIQETIEILETNKSYYEDYHKVTYPSETINKLVELSNRYITDRSLPDSAIDILDLSGAYTCLSKTDDDEIVKAKLRLKELNTIKTELLNMGRFEDIDSVEKEENKLKKTIANNARKLERTHENYTEITIDDIAKAISDVTNIPINKLNTDEKKKISEIDKILKRSIIGQDEAIDGVCRIIKRNKVGLGDKKKVSGAVLLIGQSGTGKTLLAKKLAEEIYGSERELVRIDMSEYSEKNSVSKLLGSAPGYVGFENGGQLTEAIKNKQHCVLLLDEIEKADNEVYNLFLQLFDEGRLTDSSGQVVNFKNVIVLMTSNIGAKQAQDFGKTVGFVGDEANTKKSIVEKQLKKTFTPEFINRIDQIVHFNPLTDETLENIVRLELNKFGDRLKEIGFEIKYDDAVVKHLFESAIKEREYGARPIIRLIQDNIEDKITDLVLENNYTNGYVFNVTVNNDKIEIN